MGPLAIISLISTASDVVQGISNLVSGDSGANGSDGQSIFSNLVNGASTAQTSTQNSKTSLDVTPQGSIGALNTQGAAILNGINGGSSEISDQTLEDINNILAGNAQPTDVNALSDNGDLGDAFSDTEAGAGTNPNQKVNVLGTTKLDDPFGIKAAEANGSPIAAPGLIAADSTANNLPIANLGDGTQGDVAVNTNVNSGITKQTENNNLAAMSTEAKDINKGKILNLADKVSGDATTNLQDATVGKPNTKTANSTDFSSQQVAANLADKAQDKSTLLNANPSSAAILAHQLEPKAIGDAVRAIRAKDGLKDDLSTIDTYKVVSVSKKDNVIDLRLEPSQLGKVQIKLDFTDGKANVMVTADRPETLNLLQKDTKALEKILTDNGINADSSSLSFDLRGQNQNQQQQGNDNFNFFSGKPLSFRVEEQLSNIMAANNDLNSSGYANYGESAANGMLNIIV